MNEYLKSCCRTPNNIFIAPKKIERASRATKGCGGTGVKGRARAKGGRGNNSRDLRARIYARTIYESMRKFMAPNIISRLEK